ncbi:MAG: DnaD domain protein [Anaerolineales bacterium]|nr:DnaD domain protein [Anaerolineales bacterium]
MAKFPGFQPGKAIIPIPDSFFSDLLLEINDITELKITLYLFWKLSQQTKNIRFLRAIDIEEDRGFCAGIISNNELPQLVIARSLEQAQKRGSVLSTDVLIDNNWQTIYLLNTPKGRAILENIKQGKLDDVEISDVTSVSAKFNIYRLYEENIGPLTPMISDALEEAEKTYPDHWIEKAMRIAVENNVRKWQYVLAILDKWQTKGLDDEGYQRESEQDFRRFSQGRYSEYVDRGEEK